MQTADAILAQTIDGHLTNLKRDILVRFRTILGLPEDFRVPEIITEGCDHKLMTMLESEYTQMLLEILVKKGTPIETPITGS